MTESEKFTQSFDGREWAKGFVATMKEMRVRVEHLNHIPMQDSDVEDWMHVWFANAIMRGFDEANRRNDAKMREFVGWLSGDIPELHQVTVPTLAESLERFLAK